MRRSICFSRALVSDTVFTTVRSSSGCVRLSSIGFTRGYVEDCRQSISPLCLGKAIVGAQKRLRAPPRGSQAAEIRHFLPPPRDHATSDARTARVTSALPACPPRDRQ